MIAKISGKFSTEETNKKEGLPVERGMLCEMSIPPPATGSEAFDGWIRIRQKYAAGIEDG